MGKYLDNLDLYDTDLKEIKTISKKEEKKLFTRYRNGDMSAKNEIIKSYLTVIRRMVSKYDNINISLEDLIQDAGLYLVDLISNMDISDTKKIANIYRYLYVTITNLVAYQKRNPLLSGKENDALNKINKYVEKFESINGYTPNEYLIAANNGLTLETVRYILINKETVYLDENKNIKYNNIIEEEYPERIVCSKLGYEKLRNDILKDKKLTDLEKQYISTVYGFFDDEVRTYKEVGKMYNINESTIGQVTRSGLTKIRKYAPYIKDYR